MFDSYHAAIFSVWQHWTVYSLCIYSSPSNQEMPAIRCNPVYTYLGISPTKYREAYFQVKSLGSDYLAFKCGILG